MNKVPERIPFRSRIVVRLWLIMMLLAALGVAFMWVAQVFLFERNYVNATVAEQRARLLPIMEELKTQDLAQNESLILSLSKATSGKMVLLDGAGGVIAMYSGGHPLIDQETLDQMAGTAGYILQTEEYQRLLDGESYDKLIRSSGEAMTLEIGIPVIYGGEQAAAFLFQGLDALRTVLALNRSQLFMLSALLTLAAAALAALLSRHFVKPIRAIKRAVQRLAKGDLTAKPGISLRDELGQLAGSVEDLGRALQRVDVLRKEVIANVSHELRAPLSLIAGYAEMVRDINWRDDEKRNADLSLIISEAGRMSEMVSDIMDYSQLQAGYIQLKLEPYNLVEIVESEVMSSAQSAKAYNISVYLESALRDIPVHVDALKISQVMRNLLGNAINHTADGGTISVVVEKAGDAVRVSVINPGEPIPEEDMQVIWARYQRSQHQGGRKQGTGIGLSIVSTFLDAHDMSYGVGCADGYTTFWFECRTEKTSGAQCRYGFAPFLCDKRSDGDWPTEYCAHRGWRSDQ